MEESTSLLSQCQFASHYLPVFGSKMHYYDEGQGDPILFLHGIPVSAYLWRNIIPKIKPFARCIAPDLIGMGKSDKPDIAYRVFDHIAYLDQFIEQLHLKNITLVMHGWGSVIGFDYARRHEPNIKALAFYEAHIQPVEHWQQLSLPVQQLTTLLNRKEASYRAVVHQNYLIERLLPASVMRKLTDAEMAHYREPFPTPESRKPLWQYVNELPLGNGPSDVTQLIQRYSDWLQQTPIPKLMLYAIPGFVVTMESLQWARQHFQHLQCAELNHALHLAPESIPELFSAELARFIQNQK